MLPLTGFIVRNSAASNNHISEMRKFLWIALAICLAGQVIPFHIEYPTRLVSSELPAEYVESFLKAEQFSRALDGGAIWYMLSTFPAALLLILSGLPVRVEQRWGSTRLRWPARIAFMFGVAFWMNLVGIPYSMQGYFARVEVGLTGVVFTEWMRLLIVGLPIPFLMYVISSLLVYCSMPIFGRAWWIAAALLTFLVFSVVPEWVSLKRPIDPVVTMTRLPEGQVRDELDRVAALADYDLDYFVDDTSKRSRRVNMYVSGRLGREYVGLTDTIVHSFSPQEISVVMAHELWHQIVRRKSFMISMGIGLIIGVTELFVVFLVTGRSRIDDPNRLHALLILLLVQSVVSPCWYPVSSALSRQEERDADRYALELLQQPELLRSAILKSSKINVIPFRFPRWIYWWTVTHPTIQERLALIDQWETRGSKNPPRSPP
jgi:STE24 endopeptidase